MEDESTPVEALLQRAQAFTRTSIKLFKYKATDKLAEMLSGLAVIVIIVVVLSLFFVNLNFGIALLLGDLFGKTWLGFIVVAGFYGVIGLIVYLFRDKWIKRPVSEAIILELLADEDDDQLAD